MEQSLFKVGIICPASLEYEVCRDILKLSEEDEFADRLISSRQDNGVRVIALQAGPGKIYSASATQFIIDRFAPDVVLDVGGAGILNPELAIFDIVCSEYAYEYDIVSIEEFSSYADDFTTNTILPGLSKAGKHILYQFAEHVKRENSARLEIGSAASGELNVNEKALRDKLFLNLKASICNWETSAILKTAQINGVRALSFRITTDTACETMSEELKANWKKALQTLFPVLKEFLFGGWLLRIMKCP